MANQLNGYETFQHQPYPVDLELLEALLEPEDNTYPWNPADAESEDYFRELEDQFVMGDILEEELSERSQAFYNRIDGLWEKTRVAVPAGTALQTALHTSFGSRIPENWLNAIAQKAAEIFSSQQSMGEQLVQCVQTVLPTWGTDDLLVLARPYAYAMRGSEQQNAASLVANVDDQEWTNLSEIEQAKISLAIASYALNQLNSFQ